MAGRVRRMSAGMLTRREGQQAAVFFPHLRVRSPDARPRSGLTGNGSSAVAHCPGRNTPAARQGWRVTWLAAGCLNGAGGFYLCRFRVLRWGTRSSGADEPAAGPVESSPVARPSYRSSISLCHFAAQAFKKRAPTSGLEWNSWVSRTVPTLREVIARPSANGLTSPAIFPRKVRASLPACGRQANWVGRLGLVMAGMIGVNRLTT